MGETVNGAVAPDSISGWRVLVPRGGRWADDVAEHLAAAGAEAVLVPLVEFSPPADPVPLREAVARLNAGTYDWLLITSTTALDALVAGGASVPSGTRVAALGELTAAAVESAGIPVAFRPVHDHSPRGLVDEWPPARTGERVLLPQSQLADATLPAGLGSLGLEVDRVAAYRAAPVPAADALVAEVAAGGFQAIAITAGSIAARVADEFAPLPIATRIVCIGPRTAGEAATAGLRVAAVAADRSAAALVEALRRSAGTVPIDG